MKSYSEEYNDGVSKIKDILSKENVIKTEEKASLYDYLRIVRKYFRPFNKAFLEYSSHTSDDEPLYKISVFPYYYSIYRDCEEMWLWLRLVHILEKEELFFLLKKEYNSDFFRYDDEYYYDSINGNKIKSSFYQQFALKNVVNYYYDDFLELFTTMEDYFEYRDCLGIVRMTYKDSSFSGLDLGSGFNYKINIIGDGSITCNLDFSELDKEVVRSKRSDRKASLAQLLIDNQDEILKRIPISIYHMVYNTESIYQKYWNSFDSFDDDEEKIYCK